MELQMKTDIIQALLAGKKVQFRGLLGHKSDELFEWIDLDVYAHAELYASLFTDDDSYTWRIKPYERLFVELDNGKYTVIQDDNGSLYALRYGKEWRNLCGDNLIYHLAVEVTELREKINNLEAKITS